MSKSSAMKQAYLREMEENELHGIDAIACVSSDEDMATAFDLGAVAVFDEREQKKLS